MPYHKAEIEEGIFNLFIFFNFQNPFPGTIESHIFLGSAGLRVNNYSSPSSERKSIIIDLAPMGWQYSHCPCTERGEHSYACVELGALTLPFPSLSDGKTQEKP